MLLMSPTQTNSYVVELLLTFLWKPDDSMDSPGAGEDLQPSQHQLQEQPLCVATSRDALGEVRWAGEYRQAGLLGLDFILRFRKNCSDN